MSSVSYSILLNGSPYGFFKPSRGLRQGDPLSLLLFIIGSKVFSRLLSRKESHGNLHGISIGRGVPPISHLLYANDLLIFAKLMFGKLKFCLHAYRDMVVGLGNNSMCKNPQFLFVVMSAHAEAKRYVIFWCSPGRIMWKKIWGFWSLSPKTNVPSLKSFVKESSIVWRVGRCAPFLEQGV